MQAMSETQIGMQRSYPLATPMLLKTMSQECSLTWARCHNMTHKHMAKLFHWNEVGQSCLLDEFSTMPRTICWSWWQGWPWEGTETCALSWLNSRMWVKSEVQDGFHPLVLEKFRCAVSILPGPCLPLLVLGTLHQHRHSKCCCWQLGLSADYICPLLRAPPFTTMRGNHAARSCFMGNRRPVGCSQRVALSGSRVVWRSLAETEVLFGVPAPHFWWWQ